jgi:hypothetical protein
MDPTRTAGVSWFTGFVPYWNEGLIMLPRTGKPTFVVGMSNRVNGWIRRNGHFEDVINTPRIGPEAGKALAKRKPNAVVAIPELDQIPSIVIEGILENGNGLSLIDGTALLERARTTDFAELALTTRAGEIARRALAQITPRIKDGGALAAAVEGQARRMGAEEVYVAIAVDLDRDRKLVRLEGAPVLGRLFAVRLSVAYKGAWVRMTRTVASDAGVAVEIEAAREKFATAIAGLPRRDGFAGFSSWLVEGCRAIQQLEPLMGSALADSIPPAPGSVVTVQATLDGNGRPFLFAAPVLIGRSSEAASMLVPASFDDAA